MANSKKFSQWLHNPYTGEEIEITATTENALNNKCEKQIKAWEKEQAEWGRQQYVEEQKLYVQQMDEENLQLIQNLRRHMLSYIVRWSSYRYYDGLKRKPRYSDISSPPTIKEINKELKVPIKIGLWEHYADGEEVIRRVGKNVPTDFITEPIHVKLIYDSGILNLYYVNKKMRSYDRIFC